MNNCPLYTNLMLISHSIGLQRDMCFITDIAASEIWGSGPDGEQQDTLSPHLAMSVSSQTAICIKFPEHVFHLQAAVWKQKHTGHTGMHMYLCTSFHILPYCM